MTTRQRRSYTVRLSPGEARLLDDLAQREVPYASTAHRQIVLERAVREGLRALCKEDKHGDE